MRRHVLLASVFSLSALPATVLAQPAAGQPPPRGAAPTVNTQGASIFRGRVVDLQTGQPLRQAKVETVHDDWTFAVGTFWSPSVLAVPGLPPGWIFSSVQYAGRERVDAGLPLREGQPIGDVQLAITSRGSRVSAKVTDDKGAPVREHTLVVYSEDAERWGPLSRYRAIARPDQKGESLTDPLPPAMYLVVAVSAFEEGAEGDPAFLERLRPLATPVDLREGVTHGLALALAQEP